jgi:hypothetical protein
MADFAAAWDEAIEEARDLLQAEAWQRALKRSDVLLIFLLKAYRPEKYGDRMSLRHAGKIDLTKLSDAELERYAARLDRSV